MNNDIIKMFDTNELNRLQRCAKNKDKNELKKWGQDFERRIAEVYLKKYRNYYLQEYAERLKDLDTALMYVLHFGATRFGNKRLQEIMNDLSVTIKDLHKEDFKRSDYREMLIKDGIKIEKNI